MTRTAPRRDPALARRVARLAAVQALYQVEVAGVGADAVLLEFLPATAWTRRSTRGCD